MSEQPAAELKFVAPKRALEEPLEPEQKNKALKTLEAALAAIDPGSRLVKLKALLQALAEDKNWKWPVREVDTQKYSVEFVVGDDAPREKEMVFGSSGFGSAIDQSSGFASDEKPVTFGSSGFTAPRAKLAKFGRNPFRANPVVKVAVQANLAYYLYIDNEVIFARPDLDQFLPTLAKELEVQTVCDMEAIRSGVIPDGIEDEALSRIRYAVNELTRRVVPYGATHRSLGIKHLDVKDLVIEVPITVSFCPQHKTMVRMVHVLGKGWEPKVPGEIERLAQECTCQPAPE